MQHAGLRWDPQPGSNVIPMENLEGRISGEAHRVMVRSAADGGAMSGEVLEGWWNWCHDGEATTLFAFGGVAFSCPTSSTKPVMSWDSL